MRKKVCILAISAMTICSVPVSANTHTISTTQKVLEHSSENQIVDDGVFEVDKVSEKKIIKFYKKNSKKKKLTKIDKYKLKVEDLGIVKNSRDDDFTKIKSEDNKKSKTAGYIKNNSAVKVIEYSNNFYKIKSGKVTGYIGEKDLLVDKEVEPFLLKNKNVTASFHKGNTNLRNSEKSKSTVIGVCYKNSEYPIVKFSKDYKKAEIKRSETVTGWVSVKEINIGIESHKAMTTKAYKEYVAAEKKKEQEALDQALKQAINASIGTTGNSLVDASISLISHNESGDFRAARNKLSRFAGEKTITVGAWQWYGERAHNLLKEIYAADKDKAFNLAKSVYYGKKREENAKKFITDIISSDNWESTKRKFTDKEITAVKALLGSSNGVSAQKNQVKKDVANIVSIAKNTYNLKNPALVVYFADMFWQSPNTAREVAKQTIDYFKGTDKLNADKNGLAKMHEFATKSSTFGKFSTRRNYTYSACKKLNSGTVDTIAIEKKKQKLAQEKAKKAEEKKKRQEEKAKKKLEQNKKQKKLEKEQNKEENN